MPLYVNPNFWFHVASSVKFSALTIIICVPYSSSSSNFPFFFCQLTCEIILSDFFHKKKKILDVMLGVKEVINKMYVCVCGYVHINTLLTF